jgi:multicomponent Na+:H+ antiporter subunit F
MRVVIVVSAVMLAAAVVLVIRRVEVGPSMLDRVVALDVLVSSLLAGFALYVTWADRPDLVPTMVALSLVGFVGAVSIARFAAVETDEERRILSDEEVARLAARTAARFVVRDPDDDADPTLPGARRAGDVGDSPAGPGGVR